MCIIHMDSIHLFLLSSTKKFGGMERLDYCLQINLLALSTLYINLSIRFKKRRSCIQNMLLFLK